MVSKILLLLGNPGYGNTNVDTTTTKVASDSGVGPFKYSTHHPGLHKTELSGASSMENVAPLPHQTINVV